MTLPISIAKVEAVVLVTRDFIFDDFYASNSIKRLSALTNTQFVRRWRKYLDKRLAAEALRLRCIKPAKYTCPDCGKSKKRPGLHQKCKS